MAHIDLKNNAPGILGLMAYKPSTALALNNLAETILRGPSTLTQGERELIAGCVSYFNECNFCHRSHAAAAEYCLKKDLGYTERVASDIEGSDVSPKMKALLLIAKKVQKDGRTVHADDIARAKKSGASDEEIHDAVMVAAAFCMFNRYVDGMGTFAPEVGAPYYEATGEETGNYWLHGPETNLSMAKGPTEFSKKVLSYIAKIPEGKVATYSQIAKLAGKPQGVRGVVWILHSSSAKSDLPWHRVINSKGRISFPPMTEDAVRQRRLLEKEGILFDHVDQVDLKVFQWKKSLAKAL